ncbi:MAG: hypothetical protein E7335_01265 [Clostridiales bacterium]|nr:hypothetical protein [Clostridiales bacterium]
MRDSMKIYDFRYSGFMKDGLQSIPLGNGEIGANVWIEEDGALRLLFSRSDAWSEACRLIKTGMFTLSVSPNPFADGAEFYFSLADATLYIRSETSEIRLYMDANAPCLRLSAEFSQPVSVRFAPLNYRDRSYEWKDDPSNYHMQYSPIPCPESADVVFSGEHIVGQYHFNESSCYEYTMHLQKLEDAMAEVDPLLHRVFGCAAYSEDLQLSDGALCACNVPKTAVSIFSLTQEPASSPEKWHAAMNALIEKHGIEKADSHSLHAAHWLDAWKSCYVFASGCEDAFNISRAFLYQRYMNLCAGSGKYPIKFNGSLFTAGQMPDHPGNYDARNWGGPYWLQNTRLVYWALLACGDYAQMKPFLRMCIDLIPISRERARAYWNHDGMLLPETFTFFGTYSNENYGYADENGIRRNPDRVCTQPGSIPNPYIRWHYSGMVEIAWMMMRYVSLSGDTAFLPDALEFSRQVILFFMNHFEILDGKLMMIPVSSMETWQHCLNDLPDISGLTVLTEAIMESGAADEELLSLCRKMRQALPELPTEIRDGKRVLAPCEVKVDPVTRNVENPELYAVFPFGQYILGKPDIDLARDTYFARRFRHKGGWSQDPVQSALLGLTDEAAAHVIRQSTMVDERCIFPAFWGPNFDETPDQDHGSNIILGVASMLIQSGDDDRILPAWPGQWDVHFRLPAGKNRFAECVYRDEKIVSLEYKNS